jgi:tetratricopeptide (TPR) repeat protein
MTGTGSIDENAIRRFEAAWRGGKPQPVEDFLPPLEHPAYLGTLQELILIELEFAWKVWLRTNDDTAPALQPPAVETYLARFPQLNQPPIVNLLREHVALLGQGRGDNRPVDAGQANLPGVGVATIEDGLRRSPVTPADLPQVPGYEVLELLGHGGMGVVYKARQLSLGRLVALKMIVAGAAAEAEDLARFRTEAEAVACLQHPNIIQIHEVGQVQGSPYVALEYVAGGSLAQKLAGQPQPPRAGAQLVETLADAMHHAHERGILHRDLKPANVLLAACGLADPASPQTEFIPKITDFGLAKKLDVGSGQTQTGAILGTPSYMAPEQAQGAGKRVGPAADVYALGAILYECLTGRPPFKAVTLYDTLQQVLNQEPVPVRYLQPQVPRDLETICLKCLRKEPGQRYASGADLADDLRRFLNGEPIQARPIGSVERLGRWCRRNPRVAVLTAAVAGLLVAVSALSTLGALYAAALRAREHEQWQRAENNAAEAIKRQEEAERARQRTWKALEDVSDLGLSDPLSQQKALTPQQEQLLKKLLAYVEEFAKETGQTPEGRAQVAKAHYRVGFIRKSLGLNADAESACRRAVALFVQLAHEFPDVPGHRSDLAGTYNILARALDALGRGNEARSEYQNAITLWQKLSEEIPTEPDFRVGLATSKSNLAILLQDLGEREAARTEYQEAIAIDDKLVADFPEVPDYRASLALLHNNLAALLVDLGENLQARSEYEKAIAIQETLHEQFPTWSVYRAELATSYNNLGTHLLNLGKGVQSRTDLEKAIKLRTGLVGEFPAAPDFRADLAHSHNDLGTTLENMGLRKEAQDEYLQAISLAKNLADAFPDVPSFRQQLAQGHNNLGSLLQFLGQLEEARTHHQQALELREKLGSDFPTVPDYQWNWAHSHNNLALVIRDLGRKAEARKEYVEAIRILSKLAGDYPQVPRYKKDLACSHNNLGRLLEDLVENDAAHAEYEKELAIYDQLATALPSVPRYRQGQARSHSCLGNLMTNAGHGEKAQSHYAKAMDLLQNLVTEFPTMPEYREELGIAHHNLGTLFISLDQREKAEAALRQAVGLQEKLQEDFPTEPAYARDLALARSDLGLLLVDMGRQEEAQAEYRKAIVLGDALTKDFPEVPDYPRNLANTSNSLGMMLLNLGRWEEAQTEFRKALDLQDRLANAFPTDPSYRAALARTCNNLGVALTKLGRSGEAMARLQQAITVQNKLLEVDPGDASKVAALGRFYSNMGNTVRDVGQPEAALDWYTRAISQLEPALIKDPQQSIARDYLRDSHERRAQALGKLARHARALADWERAIELDDQNQPGLRVGRARSLIQLGNHEKAVAALDAVVKEKASGQLLYEMAGIYALSTAQVKADARLRDRYAMVAVSLLGQTRETNHFADRGNLERLKKDPSFDSLRQRDDFKKLMSELGKGMNEPAVKP